MPLQPLLSLLLAAQAAAGGAGAEEERALPRIVDDPCRKPDGEIVVCGRRGESDKYRITGLPTKQEQKIRDPGIPVGIDLNGTTRLGVVVDQVVFPQGMISQRAMVSVRIKF
ncbi:MAG: hypothetical protein E6G94_15710 [Alphaproteobacteria bacterium]|nr:MAG: hypothetical protein E6G94_15710 [Alphaproteobacteria bacterium]